MGHWSAPKRDAGTEAPPGRGGHGSVALPGNKLLVFGGADRTPQGFNDLWLLEVVDGQRQCWTKISPKLGPGLKKLPIPRSGCSLTLVDGKVYIYGGQEPVSGAILDELLVLQVGSWELHAVTAHKPYPPARHSHTAGIFEGDSVVVFGGAGLRGPLNDVWAFNTRSQGWACLSEGLAAEACPVPREMAAGCVISDAGLFVHGGRGSEGEILNDVAIFDGRAGKWVLIQSTPYARCAHTATNAVQQLQALPRKSSSEQAQEQPPAEQQQEQQTEQTEQQQQEAEQQQQQQQQEQEAEQPLDSSDGSGAATTTGDAAAPGSNATPPLASNVLLYGGFSGEAVSGDMLQLSFLRQSYGAGGASLRVELRPVKSSTPGEAAAGQESTALAGNPPARFAHSAVMLQGAGSGGIAVFGGVNQTDDLNDLVVWTL